MQRFAMRCFLSVVLVGACGLFASNAWAHLPHPVETSGVVLAVDHETQTLVLKEGKGKKPLLLDWDKETEFLQDGKAVGAAALVAEVKVGVSCKRISFRNPLLKKVSWTAMGATK